MLWHKILGAGGNVLTAQPQSIGQTGGTYGGTGVAGQTLTISSADLGTDATNRFIIVGAAGNGSTSFSCTVGGSSATSQITGGEGTNRTAALFAKDISGTGSTGDIVVDFGSSATTNRTVAYFIAYGLPQLTADRTDTSGSTNSNNRSLSLDSTFFGAMMVYVAPTRTYTYDSGLNVAYENDGGCLVYAEDPFTPPLTVSWTGDTNTRRVEAGWDAT